MWYVLNELSLIGLFGVLCVLMTTAKLCHHVIVSLKVALTMGSSLNEDIERI